MPKISVPQKNLVFTAEAGANLMQVLLAAKVPVASSCLGDGICGKCRVQLIGKANLANDLELQTLTKNKAEPLERLSCQAIVIDSLEIKTSYW